MFNLIITTSETVLADTGLTQEQLDNVLEGIEFAAELWGRYIDAPDADIDLFLSFENLGDALANAGPNFFSFNGGPFLSEVTEELNGRPDSGGVLSYGEIDANLTVNLARVLEGDFFFTDSLEYVSSPGAQGQFDFLSLIAHELGHALGFNSIAFQPFFSEGAFTGENAVAANGGVVELVSDGVHLVGNDLLGTTLFNNTREVISAVHIGILEDIGVPIVEASQSADVLYGFNLVDDLLDGQSGDDTLFGLTGDDLLSGNQGRDSLNGGQDNDQLLGDAARSLSLDSLEGQLYRAFEAVFDRAPDAGGFNAFLTEMRLGNRTQEEVIAEFVMSAEFQQTFGALDNQAFIEQLFRNVLDREGDAEGIAAFTAALDGGRERASVVVEFANSPEFLQLTSLSSAAFATNVIINPAEAQVFRIYQAVFLRDPDEAGFTAFTNSIQAGVLTVEEITAEFVASEEFQITYGNLDNTDFVELLFANVLPGNMDAQGRADFIDALDAGTLTREAMVAEFVETFEFVQRMEGPAIEFVASTFTSSGDTLDGGTGNDLLFGGRGADEFVFDTEGGGADTILDFTAGTDLIDLGSNTDFDSFAEVLAVAAQQGQDTILDFGGGNTLTLEGVILSELTAEDFGFDVMG